MSFRVPTLFVRTKNPVMIPPSENGFFALLRMTPLRSLGLSLPFAVHFVYH